jgi:hypothetical protein
MAARAGRQARRRARRNDVTTTDHGTGDNTGDNDTGDNDTGAVAAERKPKRGGALALILVGLGALVIGGIVGAAVGFKVEQNRTKDDVKGTRPIGQVTAVDNASVTIKLPQGGGTRTYVVSDGTDVETTSGGKPSDLDKGARVLVRSKKNSNGDREATQIVILPKQEPGSAS